VHFFQTGFEFLPTMAVSLCGGVLGVLFTIPLRRAVLNQLPQQARVGAHDAGPP